MLDGFPLYFWEFLILNLPLYRLLMANHNFPKGIGTNVRTGQPYMLLTSYESKNAIESTGQTNFTGSRGTILSSIALYIPPNALKTAFKSTYDATPGAAIKAGMVAATQRLSMSNAMDTLLAGFKGAGMSIGGKIAEQADKGTGMLAAQGIAVNNHLALTYKGPTQFRTHEFAFKFFPKNSDEADVIQEIIIDLENGMLPKMGGANMTLIKGRKLSAPYFQSPRHWTIDFFTKVGTKNKYLFEIKKSVITDMVINHDPNSTVSFHGADKNGKGEGSPVETDLSLTFQEIELPISGQAGRNLAHGGRLDQQ